MWSSTWPVTIRTKSSEKGGRRSKRQDVILFRGICRVLNVGRHCSFLNGNIGGVISQTLNGMVGVL